MCQRRGECTWSILPDECVYYILNMCRWDWFNDNSVSMKETRRRERAKQNQRALVQQLEQQAIAPAESGVDNHSMEDAKPSATDNRCARITRSQARASCEEVDEEEEVSGVDDEFEEEDNMEEDDDGDGEEDDDYSDEQSDVEDQYHTADRRQFRFHVVDSDDEEGEVARGGTSENQRRDWIRRQFARIHVLRALATMEDRAVDVMEG
jgi:Rps23 Pro-64 3,4-dihydroxylase Tpa1-like proline 4-hydroxylase